jgi:hypothetical protein
MLAGKLLQMRRMEITLGDFFGEAAMFFVCFRVHREKSHILRGHLVLLDKTISERRRGRTKRAFGADLNRHDDKPWQRMDDQFHIIEMSRGGGQELCVFELVPCDPNGFREANRELVMAGTAGIHTARFFFDDTPKLLRDLRIIAGQITQHGNAWDDGAKLIILNRPGANLIHGGGAVAYGFQEGMLDTDLGKRLDVFFQLLHELRRRHVTVLLKMISCWWSNGVVE